MPGTDLAFLADWNATPADRGRWSPDWLADVSDLDICSAGPGRHGDIDYLMATCTTVAPHRLPPPGPTTGRGDHDVFAVTIWPDGDRRLHALKLASWNVQFGRNPQRVAEDLHQLLLVPDLDAVALQEAADYHQVIREVAKRDGWQVLMSPVAGRWHNVLLVRDAVATEAPRFTRLSPRGWRLVRGGRHAELWATSWLVGGWCRVVSLHLPPSVNWRRGRIYGPPMRVAAYVATMSKLRRWARNNSSR